MHHQLPAAPTWAGLEALVRQLCELDVAHGEQPALRVLGARGGRVLGCFELPPGAGPSPGRLVLRLGLGLQSLGADRLAAALPARAWSLEDPVPPVADGVDLRQRVVALTTARPVRGGAPRLRTRLLPFDVVDDLVRWSTAEAMDGPGEGAVPAVLATLLRERRRLDTASPEDRAETVVACLRTGVRVVAPSDSPLAVLAS